MEYFEITVDAERAELDRLCGELTDMGLGFIVEDEKDFREFLENNRQYWDYVDSKLEKSYNGLCRIKFYLNNDEIGIEQLEKIKIKWPECYVSSVKDSDWENNWKEFYKPIEIGKRLIVVPEWENIPKDDRMPLILDPGLIFGTGSHATTRMCLEVLDSMDLTGKKILDLGCGSGILGIGALVLGAESNTGVDIDPKAPDVAMSNAALNGIGADRMKVYAGDVICDSALTSSLGGGYDIILANIVADVIISLAPKIHLFMGPDAVFICSGIIDGRKAEVLFALRSAGMNITVSKSLEEWNCFVCRSA